MSDIDILINEEAHKYTEGVAEPITLADINEAFKQGFYKALQTMDSLNTI